MRIVLLFISLFMIKMVYAQNSINLNQLIQSIKSGKSSRKTVNQQLSIEDKFINHTFRDYDILVVDQNNYRILAQEDNFELNLIVKNGQTRGVVLDHSQNTGYKINYEEKLSLLPSPKEEIIFVCTSNHKEKHPSHNHNLPKTKQKKEIPNFGNINQVSDILLLESKENAKNLIYIDYDGEATLPGWDEHFHYSAKAGYIPKDVKRKIWESIAEDFIQFDVNVTTNRELFEKHEPLNRQMLVVAEFGVQNWLGVALLGSFGSGKPALVDIPSDYNDESTRYLYRTGSHELGHTLGLNHDGGTTGAYYTGHGEFTPIMGSGIRSVNLWSKGDYPSATNHEDDIQIIGDWLNTNSDDYPFAVDLKYTDHFVDPAENFGIIETRDDKDTFRVELNEYGSIRLKVSSPIGDRTNLDVSLQLIAADKSTIIQTSNPVGDRGAYLDESLEKGNYYIVIDGGGELGTSDGFNDYGSLGYYEISGLIGYISPICDFSTSNKSLCVNDEVTVFDSSLGTDISYEWSTSENSDVVSTDISPIFSFATYGDHVINLTISNNAGSTSCEANIKVGNHPIHLIFPAEKTNENMMVSFQEEGNFLKEIKYPDLIGNDDTLSYEFCLTSDCYQISLTDVFKEETCGFSAWNSSKSYNGNDKVVYQGKIYRAKWWTKGDNPTASGSPWVSEGVCEITDDQTTISFYDEKSIAPFYQTTPLLIGKDLSDQKDICLGVISNHEPSEFLEIKVYPNPIENQLIIEAKDLKNITVFDLSGKELINIYTNGNEYLINTTSWNNGVYFVQINTQFTSHIQKILK